MNKFRTKKEMENNKYFKAYTKACQIYSLYEEGDYRRNELFPTLLTLLDKCLENQAEVKEITWKVTAKAGQFQYLNVDKISVYPQDDGIHTLVDSETGEVLKEFKGRIITGLGMLVISSGSGLGHLDLMLQIA